MARPILIWILLSFPGTLGAATGLCPPAVQGATHRSPSRLETIQDAATDTVLLFDFDPDDAGRFLPRPEDSPYVVRQQIHQGPPLRGNSLSLRIQGWSEEHEDAAQVMLRTVLARPLLVDSSTVVSWIWWVGDKDECDGVGINLIVSVPEVPRNREITWLSHATHQRDAWPYDDPEQTVVHHRQSLREAFLTRDVHFLPPPPWQVIAVEIFVLYPFDQTVFLDSLRIGPPAGAPPPRETGSNPFPAEASHTCFTTADLDQDGRLELLIGRVQGSLLSTTMEKSLSMGSKRLPGLESAFHSIQVAAQDMDGDGCLDLVSLTRRGIQLFRGLGMGEFRTMAPILPPDLAPRSTGLPCLEQTAPRIPAGMLLADMAGGREPEILLHRTITRDLDSVYTQIAPWKWVSRPIPPVCPIAGEAAVERGGYRHAAAAGDVDGDGRPDIFLSNCDLYLRTDVGLRCAGGDWLPESGSFQRDVAFGDIDNDGDLDLFIAVELEGKAKKPEAHRFHSLLYRNDGDHFTDVTENQLDTLPYQHAQNPIFEDFDLDGDLDLFFVQGRWTREQVIPPANVYLENDGHGNFRRIEPGGSWILNLPSARRAVSGDLDGDGAPDLILLPRNSEVAQIMRNPTAGDRGISVRVLDRHGVPDASGAKVVLLRAGQICGSRQSGVGTMTAGSGTAHFGCAGEGPYELRVTYPSAPRAPVVIRGLRRGSKVTTVEPAFNGPLGGWAGRFRVARRSVVRKITGAAWPATVVGATLIGLLSGVVLYAVRGRFRRPFLHAPVAVLGLAVLILVGAMPVWPRNHLATLCLILGLAGFASGGTLGGFMAHLDAHRKRAAKDGDFHRTRWRQQLLEAIDGFSHAGWVSHLGGLASLSQSLADGADSEFIYPRLRDRLDTFDGIIRPQMEEIAAAIERSDLNPEHARRFRADREVIERGVRWTRGLVHGDAGGSVGHSSLPTEEWSRFSEAARDMQVLVELIFQELGFFFRTDVVTAARSAIERAREKHPKVAISLQVPDQAPAAFAVDGELANILENLVHNGARAAAEMSQVRPPSVQVSVRRDADRLILRVRDTGPGFTTKFCKILEAPKVIDSRGHGRGLNYAMKRLKLWDGKLEIGSTSRDLGTEMKMTLRLLREKQT